MTTKMQSVELKDDNILVMSVCPGWVQTDMGTANAHLTPEQVWTQILRHFSDGSRISQRRAPTPNTVEEEYTILLYR